MSDYRDKPFSSIAKIGPSKWFYVHWPTLKEFLAGNDPLHHGVTDSVEEAIEKSGGVSWGAHYAIQWRSIFAARRRKPNLKAHPEVKVTEFVYHHEDDVSDYDSTVSHRTCAHRIIKKTAKKIFIEEDCYNRTEAWGGVTLVPQLALDRARLEGGENVFVNRGRFGGAMCGTHFTFCADHPAKDRERHDIPQCFAVLGLKTSPTAAQVKRAFRRLSRKHHPDTGGDADAFRHLYEQYETALALVGTINGFKN